MDFPREQLPRSKILISEFLWSFSLLIISFFRDNSWDLPSSSISTINIGKSSLTGSKSFISSMISDISMDR